MTSSADKPGNGPFSVNFDAVVHAPSTGDVGRENPYTSALHEIALGLLRRKDRDDLLVTIVRQAAALARTDHGFMTLLDADQRGLTLQVGTGRFEAAAGFSIPSGQGLAEKALRTGRPAVIDDYGRWHGAIPGEIFQGLRAAVAVPLVSGAGTIGLGYFGDDRRTFGPQIVEALGRFAQLASIALDNIFLQERYQEELDVRQSSQAALERRIEMDRIIKDFYLDLLQAGFAHPDPAISRGLAKVGAFSGVDRAYLFRLSDSAESMGNTHEWCARGIDPQIDRLQNLSTDAFPWWMTRLRNREAIHIPSVADLPAEALKEKNALSAQGIRSLLVVPVNSSDRFEGFVGFDAVNRAKIWSEEDTANLLTFANIIAAVISRNRIRRDLHRSEGRYRELFKTTSDLVYTQDLRGRFLTVNPALRKAFGYASEDLIGRPASDFMTDRARRYFKPEYLDVLQQKGFAEGVSSYFAKDGRKIYVEYRSHLVHPDASDACVSGIARDVTERVEAEREIRRLQEEMVQIQKMEAIGTLAGGIAHDFNNLMMGIQGRISLMQMEAGTGASQATHLREMETCVQSAVDLTRQLLGFAQGGRYEVESADLNRLVRGGTEMFGRTRKEIAIELALADDLWPVAVDRGQIEQVLLNLYLNAWQSMPSGGRLTVGTENVSLDGSGEAIVGLAPGRHVCITIADTGVGMDEATRSRLFEPFFTTRHMGRGTGLGLASAYGIVRHHGGTIRVDSAKGRGSLFSIYLPAESAVKEAGGPAEPETARGNGMILLVDDEALILDVGQEMIQALGYEVLTADGGEAAVACFAEEKDRIDLVILDMIMPRMSGEATFERLRAMDPNVSVLLSSGYSIDGQAQEILDRGCRGFLQKPFSLQVLSAKIKEVMGREGRADG